MSDPFGRIAGMTETYVTATDFRSHIAQITNCVAWRHDRVVVTRHGQEMGGYVCHEDMEFLRRYKPVRNKVPSGDIFSPIATWDDAPECLQWADENQATVAEMKAWRRALRGEDLTVPGDADEWDRDEHP